MVAVAETVSNTKTVARSSVASRGSATAALVAIGALVAATAFLLHLAVGYRPLPSLDDFAYLPAFRHAADPSLYASDSLLQQMSLHSLAWYWLLRLSDATVGAARGFWLATMLLSVASVTALLRLGRTLGMGAAMLPLLGLLVFASDLRGIGRGAYDGAFGAAFHGQWLALALLLFAYDAYVRRRSVRCGVLLGLVALAHFSVAMHGAFVVALATMLGRAPRRKPLATIALVAFVVSLPVLVPLVSHLAQAPATSWSTRQIIESGYLFRLSHEYDLDIGRAGNLAALLLVLAAVAGAGFLRRHARTEALPRIAAILVGHACLIALAVAFYVVWPFASVLPYLLSLTRTSPLLVVLLGVVAFAGLDRFVREPNSAVPFHLLAGVALALAVGFELRMFVTWSAPACALLLLGLAMLAARGRMSASGATLAMGSTALAAAALVLVVRSDVLEAEPPADAAGLFEWVRTSTPRDALFIVPPGFETFRWFAGRSAYVDFKLFPPASIESIATWRERLDDVAAPDRQALALDGWRAARDFDRCYAARNTPARIADLLSRTHASFFVWDADGLRIPPLTGSDRAPDARLEEVFRNARFTVYRLRPSIAESGSHA